MRDLFDDFMKELREREAAARGENGRPSEPDDPDPEPDGHDVDDDETDDDGEPAERPRSIDDRPTPAPARQP